MDLLLDLFELTSKAGNELNDFGDILGDGLKHAGNGLSAAGKFAELNAAEFGGVVTHAGRTVGNAAGNLQPPNFNFPNIDMPDVKAPNMSKVIDSLPSTDNINMPNTSKIQSNVVDGIQHASNGIAHGINNINTPQINVPQFNTPNLPNLPDLPDMPKIYKGSMMNDAALAGAMGGAAGMMVSSNSGGYNPYVTSSYQPSVNSNTPITNAQYQYLVYNASPMGTAGGGGAGTAVASGVYGSSSNTNSDQQEQHNQSKTFLNYNNAAPLKLQENAQYQQSIHQPVPGFNNASSATATVAAAGMNPTSINYGSNQSASSNYQSSSGHINNKNQISYAPPVSSNLAMSMARSDVPPSTSPATAAAVSAPVVQTATLGQNNTSCGQATNSHTSHFAPGSGSTNVSDNGTKVGIYAPPPPAPPASSADQGIPVKPQPKRRRLCCCCIVC